MAIVNSRAFSFSNTLPAIDMADDVKAWLTRYGSDFVSAEITGDESNAYMTCTMNNLVCFQNIPDNVECLFTFRLEHSEKIE